MKNLITIITGILIISACGNNSEETQMLEERVDSLENLTADIYKPQLGEFMTYIQIHHAKLWFAGKNKNWKLADFEYKEIQETFGNIKKYDTDRPEIKLLNMIDPVMDNVGKAISQQDENAFETSYTNLTNTCNTCHTAAKYEFNVVKIPDAPPFANQDFKAK